MSGHHTTLHNLMELSPCVNARLLEEIVTHSIDAILWVNLNGRVLWTNASAQSMLKIAERGVYWDLLSDDFFGFSMREALKFGLSYRLLYKRWRDKEFEISTTFIYEGGNEEQGLLIFCRDISEIQKLKEVAQRNDRMRELGQMNASLAHEMRNALGGVRGFAMLLERELADAPPLQEMTRSIIEGTKGMERLVNSVLCFAKPVELAHLRSVEMGPFLYQFGKWLRIDPHFGPGVQWMLHVPDDPILAPIDPERMRAALLNVALNAIQAMPQGGMLTMSLLRVGQWCEISLSDTGIGMNEEQLRSLFTPFFTTKPKGNGLGLVEAQKIIQAHGGKIEARSTLGKGSTFVITLPLKRGGA